MSELSNRRLIAEGREAEIYEWGEGRVLRLMRTAAQRPAMDRSTAAITAARNHGVPTPAVIETIEVDGRPGQVMERVDGRDGFAVLAAKPWTLWAQAKTLAAVHVDLHRTSVSDGLRPTHDLVRERLADSALVPAEIGAAAAAVLDDLEPGSSLCHGDYHPGNVLIDGDNAVVIDWTGATRGDPMADVARTLLILRIGVLPDDTPALMRGLALVARSLFARLYLRSYRRLGDFDPVRASRWGAVRAADRLADGIEGERDVLLEICARDLLIDGTQSPQA